MERVLGVGGSPRKGGNSDILLQHILRGARGAGVGVEEVQLRDLDYKPCQGCEKCRKDLICTGVQDQMQPLYPKVIESKGLVLVSPTHHYNVTAWMKAFIDRLYCFYDYTKDRPRCWSSRLAGQGRKAVVAAVCEQANREEGMGFTLEAMSLPIEALGYEVIGELPVFGIFDKGRITERPEALKRAEELGKELALQLARAA
jgi:multimeric flavodoxin WrbA